MQAVAGQGAQRLVEALLLAQCVGGIEHFGGRQVAEHALQLHLRNGLDALGKVVKFSKR